MMRLHLGCGTNHLPGWVNVDFNPNYSPDVLDDVMRLSKFDKGCADEILAEHVLEHLPLNGSLIALNRWREVLKIGGKLTIEVPDLKRACFEFLECQDFDPAPESILNRYPNLHRILNNQGDTWFYRGWGQALSTQVPVYETVQEALQGVGPDAILTAVNRHVRNLESTKLRRKLAPVSTISKARRLAKEHPEVERKVNEFLDSLLKDYSV